MKIEGKYLNKLFLSDKYGTWYIVPGSTRRKCSQFSIDLEQSRYFVFQSEYSIQLLSRRDCGEGRGRGGGVRSGEYL